MYRRILTTTTMMFLMLGVLWAGTAQDAQVTEADKGAEYERNVFLQNLYIYTKADLKEFGVNKLDQLLQIAEQEGVDVAIPLLKDVIRDKVPALSHSVSQSSSEMLFSRTELLNENFDAGIPGTWTVVDGSSDGFTWQGVTDDGGSTLDGTPFVFVDSDAAGSGITMDEELVSPAVDASGYSSLYIEFDQYYNHLSSDAAELDVWNGSAWINVAGYYSDIGSWSTPDFQSIDISAYANASLQVRFRYMDNGSWAWYWAVDNVVITDTPTTSDPCEDYPDANEPNDDMTTATSILTDSTVIVASICDADDIDYYSFTLSSQMDVFINTDSISFDTYDTDTYLTLYDDAGASIETDDDGGPGYLSEISITLDAGTYYVEVDQSSYATGDIFDYEVAVMATAPAAPSPYDGVIVINEIMQNPSAVSDSYGEYVELVNLSGADVDIEGWTFGDNDYESFVIYADTTGHGYEGGGGTTVVPAGGFLVLGASADTSINGGTPVDFEYGGYGELDGITLSNSSDEVILSDADGLLVDEVWYDNGATFPDPSGASMEFHPDSLAAGADNDDGYAWHAATDPFGDGDFGTPGDANGTGEVDCDAMGFTDNNEPNDDGTSATVVYDGDSLGAAICPAEDVDWYTITVADSGTLISETFPGSGGAYGTDTYLWLIDATTGDTLDEDDDAGEGWLSEVSADVAAGTYYIVADQSPAYAAEDLFDYGISFSFVTDICADIPDDNEPNDDMTTATPIATDGNYMLAAICPENDMDFYTFSISDGWWEVCIDLDNIDGNPYDTDTELELYDADGNSIDFNDDGYDCSDTSYSYQSTIFANLGPGDYFVRADNSSYWAPEDVFGYEIAVTLLGPGQDPWAPQNLTAEAGDGEIFLWWDDPEAASDSGFAASKNVVDQRQIAIAKEHIAKKIEQAENRKRAKSLNKADKDKARYGKVQPAPQGFEQSIDRTTCENWNTFNYYGWGYLGGDEGVASLFWFDTGSVDLESTTIFGYNPIPDSTVIGYVEVSEADSNGTTLSVIASGDVVVDEAGALTLDITGNTFTSTGDNFLKVKMIPQTVVIEDSIMAPYPLSDDGTVPTYMSGFDSAGVFFASEYNFDIELCLVSAEGECDSFPDVYEPNDDMTTATSVSIGDTLEAALCPYGEHDFYVVEVLSTGTLIAEIHPGSLGEYGTDTILEILDSDGNEIAYDDDGGPGWTSFAWVDVDPGTYYVHCWTTWGFKGDYGISFDFVEPLTFNIYYEDGTLIADSLQGNEYNVAGLTNDVEYCFYATTNIPDSVESASSNVACATPIPPELCPPNDLLVEAGDGEVFLAWAPPTGGGGSMAVYPDDGAYNTGSIDSSLILTDTSLVKACNPVTGSTQGWIMFDVSDLAGLGFISQIDFNFYVNDTNWPWWSATPMSSNPVTASPDVLWSDIEAEANDGYYLYQNESSSYTTGFYSLTLEGDAVADLEAAIAQGWFAMGIYDRDYPSTSYYIIMDGWAEDNPPFLTIFYDGGQVAKAPAIDPRNAGTQLADYKQNTDEESLAGVSRNRQAITTPTSAPLPSDFDIAGYKEVILNSNPIPSNNQNRIELPGNVGPSRSTDCWNYNDFWTYLWYGDVDVAKASLFPMSPGTWRFESVSIPDYSNTWIGLDSAEAWVRVDLTDDMGNTVTTLVEDVLVTDGSWGDLDLGGVVFDLDGSGFVKVSVLGTTYIDSLDNYAPYLLSDDGSVPTYLTGWDSSGVFVADVYNWDIELCANFEGTPEECGSLAGYNVYQDGGFLDYTTETTYLATGLTNGTEYCYEVSAVYDEGESVPIGPECATPTTIEPDFLTHVTGPLQATITNEGNIGFLDFDGSPGDGFVFNGDNFLYEGGLMMGISAEQVSDCIRGVSSDQDDDFIAISTLEIWSPGDITSEEGFVALEDSGAANPIGLEIEQSTFADTGDSYIIFTYEITNLNETAVMDLYVGLFFDWDVINYGDNSARYDASRRLGYAQSEQFNPTAFAGTKLLNRYSGISYRAIDNPGELYDGFTNGEKWSFLSGGIQTESLNTVDVATLLSAGPFVIDPDSSIIVGFAVIGAGSLEDMETSADAAQELWDLYFEEVGIGDEVAVIPDVFALHQNFPNPFNPLTAVPYDVPEIADVKIDIYNILGQKVRTLVTGEHEPGFYRAIWNGKNDQGALVTTGVYIYRVTALSKASGEVAFTKTRKLVLMK